MSVALPPLTEHVTVRIHRVVHPATPEVSSKIKSHQVVGINLGNGVIKGLLFGDDDLFVVLFATKGKSFQSSFVASLANDEKR